MGEKVSGSLLSNLKSLPIAVKDSLIRHGPIRSERSRRIDQAHVRKDETIDDITKSVGREDGDIARDDDFQGRISTDDERVRDDDREENNNEQIPGWQNWWHRREF